MTSALINILINNNPVKTLVGKNKADDKWKVYPLVTPQVEIHPYIVVRTTGRTPVECKDGPATSWISTAEVTCYHQNYDNSLALADAVITALDNTVGTYGGQQIYELRYADKSEGYVDTDGIGLYAQTLTFQGHEGEAT